MLLVGLSGVTNGGKSTLSRLLIEKFPRSAYICQDKYFYTRDSGKLEFKPEVHSHNWDCIGAIDWESFYKQLQEIQAKSYAYDFLFIDGFLLFKFHSLIKFDRKYFFTLTMEECLQRRLKRNYKTVGSKEYFEVCVWPAYTEYYEFCQSTFDDVVYLNGEENMDEHFALVVKNLENEN